MKDPTTRLELLENNQKRIVEAIDELKTSVVSEFKSIREELATKAPPIQYRAAIASAATAATLMAAFMTLANFWYDGKSQVERDNVASIRRQIEQVPPALLQYRIDEMTRRLRLINPAF